MLFLILNKVSFLVVCSTLFANLSATMSVGEKIKLKRVHGTAFDARYMSTTKPHEGDKLVMELTEQIDPERSANGIWSTFYISVEPTLRLSDEPAWKMKWDGLDPSGYYRPMGKRRSHTLMNDDATELTTLFAKLDRHKRPNSAHSESWQCQKTIKWLHLGPDFYPPYLRTVECTTSKCYNRQFRCKPKQYAVRILQRHRSEFTDASALKIHELTGKSVEVWKWIEVTINLYCDCVDLKKYRKYY